MKNATAEKKILIAIDSDCIPEGMAIVAGFAEFAACEAREEARLVARAAFWAAEDAANVLDASPEVIAAYEAAEVEYRKVGGLRGM